MQFKATSKGQLATPVQAPVPMQGQNRQAKQRILPFVDLTLFRQDLAELIDLFQNNLEDVEIMIDDQRITHNEQLARFDDSYQLAAFRSGHSTI